MSGLNKSGVSPSAMADSYPADEFDELDDDIENSQ